MGKGSFREASVVATGAQRFFKRPRGDGLPDNGPHIARWRCNLTGLSQIRNLYFIASNGDIYCYVARFPTQEIPEHPELIVPSKPLNTTSTGFIDPSHPHAINNLVVQLLGNEEVVATVRDDGDVVIFLVRHIQHAIERRWDPDSRVNNVADDVRPIFQINVGMSAWGLAIHTEARTVAVSANTHNVTIFRFGLVGEGVGEDQADDVLQRVVNGTANIPHIAFCNTGDDPGARWLLTTDISGYCRTIDLREMVNAQTFRFGRSTTHQMHDHFRSGWGMMFLDRRSFVTEDSVDAALGFESGGERLRTTGSVWDISGTVANVPNCNASFPMNLQGNVRSTRAHSATVPHVAVSPTQSLTTADSDSVDDTIDGGESTVTEQLGSTDTDTDGDEDELHPEDLPQATALESEPEDPQTHYVDQRFIVFQPRYLTANNLCGDLPCPILHASICSVYLLQPSNRRPSGQPDPFAQPLIGFSNALRQQLGAYHVLNSFERLNMHAYIPSLGIVILASQKGRALVLSLTRVRQYGRSVYAMRIDHILPFAEQEDAGERPLVPLAGIATGPMQGTERLPLAKKRWRLMMMYRDQTILSYEIRRQRARDSAVDLTQVH